MVSPKADAMYGFLAPRRLAARPVSEFNEAQIVRQGGCVEHWLNGVRVVAIHLGDAVMRDRIHQRKVPVELPARSPIILQNLASETWIRSIEIRALGR
jgi:hypothetical protein